MSKRAMQPSCAPYHFDLFNGPLSDHAELIRAGAGSPLESVLKSVHETQRNEAKEAKKNARKSARKTHPSTPSAQSASMPTGG